MKETGEFEVYSVKTDITIKERPIAKQDSHPLCPTPIVKEYWLDTTLVDERFIYRYNIDEIITFNRGRDLYYYNSENKRIYLDMFTHEYLFEDKLLSLVKYMECDTYILSFFNVTEKHSVLCIEGRTNK